MHHVGHTRVYAREVIKCSLELSATAVILVHSHPSSDPTPSLADIRMTKEIQLAAKSPSAISVQHPFARSGCLQSCDAECAKYRLKRNVGFRSIDKVQRMTELGRSAPSGDLLTVLP